MNNVFRIVTGLCVILVGIVFIAFLGLFTEFGINYFSIVNGVVLLIIGFVILFNKKEDEIEKIKKRKN